MRQMRSRQQDQGEDRGEECITWWCPQERGPSLTTTISVLLFYAKTVETESPWQWVLFYRWFCKWKSLCSIIFSNILFVIALISFHVTFLPGEKNENGGGCNLCRFYSFKNPQNRLLVIGKGRATRGLFFFFQNEARFFKHGFGISWAGHYKDSEIFYLKFSLVVQNLLWVLSITTKSVQYGPEFP